MCQDWINKDENYSVIKKNGWILVFRIVIVWFTELLTIRIVHISIYSQLEKDLTGTSVRFLSFFLFITVHKLKKKQFW